MPARDPYGLLGVPRDASENEIRKAYRRLAREHHPDANPDDPAAEGRFKEVQHAYEILSDPRMRREHDERSRPSTGTSSGRPRGRTGGARTGRRTVRADSLSDFFDKLGDLSYQGAGGNREFSRELRAEDLARIARLLGIPLDRIVRLLGEQATTRGNVRFGGGRPGTSSGKGRDAPPGARPRREDDRPPIPDKPPIPPKPPPPPRMGGPDDVS